MIKGIPTMDVEAVNWVNPIAIGLFDGNDYHEFIKEAENDDVMWRFLTYIKDYHPGIKLYAHCASRYDNKLILASLCQHGEIAIPEAGLIRLRWKIPNILFEDSFLLIPMSLKRASEVLEVEHKKEWDFSKNLLPWEMGDKLTAFRSYLKTDCMSLSKALYKMCELLGMSFGVMPSISLSTTSAKVFSKCFYNVDDIDSNETFEKWIREAIYGGRNEVYKRYGENINLYDVHFMYVSCYDTPMPIGKMYWTKPNIDTGTLAEAKVKVPRDIYIGPLPYRINRKLTFPSGEFEGWWDMRELRNAAKQGVDISIRRQLECEEAPILKEFGELVHRLAMGDKKKRDLWKAFGIALSGKLGQGRWRDTYRYVGDIPDMSGWNPIDENELYFQKKEYIGGRAPYIKPAICMRVRAEARIRHFNKLIEAQKRGTLYYCDTDSIYTDGVLGTGDSMGDLVLIGKADKGYFIKQKLYAIIQKRKIKQRSAGFSDLKLSEEDFKKLLNGQAIERELEELSSYKTIFKQQEVELMERKSIIKGTSSENRQSIGLDTFPIQLP